MNSLTEYDAAQEKPRCDFWACPYHFDPAEEIENCRTCFFLQTLRIFSSEPDEQEFSLTPARPS